MKKIIKEISQKPPYKVSKVYALDNVSELSIGLSNTDDSLDIVLDHSDEDIKCGVFTKEDRYWFYVNYNTKVKAYHNGAEIKPALGNRKRIVLLEYGDEISFICDENKPKRRFLYCKEF